jgi:hypothetical protein
VIEPAWGWLIPAKFKSLAPSGAGLFLVRRNEKEQFDRPKLSPPQRLAALFDRSDELHADIMDFSSRLGA